MLEEYPDILTPQKAMEILGIGKNLFYRLLNDGIIAAKRIGKKIWGITKGDLLLYISTISESVR